MKFKNGYFYFVEDEFFKKVNDPFLKCNYKYTKRPHYLALKDEKTGLFWLIPLSSKVEKFKRIIERKKEKHIPTNSIQIVNIFGKPSVLLLQDMFPISPKYIKEQYIKYSQEVHIANSKINTYIEKNAKKIITLLRKGIKLTPTQPDINKIEKIMLNDIRKTKYIIDYSLKLDDINIPSKEILETLKYDIKGIINDNNLDIEIEDIFLYGSRVVGNSTINSDLDVIFKYKGEIREDDFFNLLSEYDIKIDNIKIDFNPVKEDIFDTLLSSRFTTDNINILNDGISIYCLSINLDNKIINLVKYLDKDIICKLNKLSEKNKTITIKDIKNLREFIGKQFELKETMKDNFFEIDNIYNKIRKAESQQIYKKQLKKEHVQSFSLEK